MKKRNTTAASNTRKTSPKKTAGKSTAAGSLDCRANTVIRTAARRIPPPPHGNVQSDYAAVSMDLQQLIADSRQRLEQFPLPMEVRK